MFCVWTDYFGYLMGRIAPEFHLHCGDCTVLLDCIFRQEHLVAATDAPRKPEVRALKKCRNPTQIRHSTGKPKPLLDATLLPCEAGKRSEKTAARSQFPTFP